MSLVSKNSQKAFKVLNFEGKYTGFTDFYDLNKTEIYRSIIEIFEEFRGSEVGSLSLHIQARIKGLEWDTEFTFKRDENIILMRDVMPYFEKIEDYETCSVIKNIHEDLTKK